MSSDESDVEIEQADQSEARRGSEHRVRCRRR